MPSLGTAIARLVDALIVAFVLLIAFVVVTGGGVLDVAGVKVSVLSVGNPLFFLVVLAAVRYYGLKDRPFLGQRRLSLETFDTACLGLCRRVGSALDSISPKRAARLVVVLCVVSLAVRLLNAYVYYGFFTGDDVEIHELTIGRLLGEGWPVWNLRSPFYPMLFIYPAQWIAMEFGVAAPAPLVFVGRSVVALFASLTLVLLFIVGKRSYGTPAALLSVFVLGMSHLHVRMGSTELPRPVAAFFLVAAFGLLSERGRLAAVGAGLLVGIAAALRFSEAVFFVPALAGLVLERRWKDALLLGVGFGSALALCLGVADWLFWGRPFFSLGNAVDYTLLKGLSSRGYQPFYYYLTHLTEWSNFFAVALGLAAMAFGFWRPALWTWLPVLALSLLPHKEARYLVPVLPFLALSAGCTLWALLRQLRREASPSATLLATLLVVGALANAVFDLGGWRFRRSERSVDLARSLAPQCRQGIAVEQAWRLGGRLYLRDVASFAEIPDERLADPTDMTELVRDSRAQCVLLRNEHADDTRVAILRASGYQERPSIDPAYRVFRR